MQKSQLGEIEYSSYGSPYEVHLHDLKASTIQEVSSLPTSGSLHPEWITPGNCLIGNENMSAVHDPTPTHSNCLQGSTSRRLSRWISWLLSCLQESPLIKVAGLGVAKRRRDIPTLAKQQEEQAAHSEEDISEEDLEVSDRVSQ